MIAESCYLCGSAELLTNDHIPPKCFFPKPRPSNLISVRCCQTCHRSYAKDDEAFMILLSMHAIKNPAKQWIYENKTLPSLKTRNKKLARHIWNEIRIVPILTNIGIVPLRTIGFPQKRMERFLFRLTKGLLRNFYPSYDYSKDVFKAWALSKAWREQPAVQKIVSKCIKRCTWVGSF